MTVADAKQEQRLSVTASATATGNCPRGISAQPSCQSSTKQNGFKANKYGREQLLIK
jgi:hypothetical protein